MFGFVSVPSGEPLGLGFNVDFEQQISRLPVKMRRSTM